MTLSVAYLSLYATVEAPVVKPERKSTDELSQFDQPTADKRLLRVEEALGGKRRALVQGDGGAG